MARRTVSYQIGGLDAAIDQLDGFQRRLPGEIARALDPVLARAEETSRSTAHVHGGQLKASIRSSSEFYAGMSQTWVGRVETDERGAIFELQRGGDHAAFIDGLTPAHEQQFEDAIADALDRAWTG